MPFSLCLPLHFHVVFVWFSLPFLSLTFEFKLYGIFRPYSQMGQSNSFEHSNNEWHGSCDAGLPTWKPWFGSSSTQHPRPYISFFYNLSIIRFWFCSEYIRPRFTRLGLLMISLAMDSNFCILHPRQPQQHLILCIH